MILWRKESNSDEICYINLLSKAEQNQLKTSATAFENTTNKNDGKSKELRVRGNQHFSAKNWDTAMEFYNQSLRYAIDGSENISLAYANRSACFLEKTKYDQCLADIELAKKANYPQRLMQKLKEREEKCLKSICDNGQRKLNEKIKPTLSFDADEKYPCLANVLEIRCNDEFGNHIVAARDIGVGQIVMLQDGFVSAAYSDDKTLCKTCLKSTKNFISAKNCSDAMFCGELCIESNDIHKFMCGTPCNQCRILALLTESVLKAITAFPNTESLMNFVLAKHNFDSQECGTDAQSKYGLFLGLYRPPQGDLNTMVTGLISSVYNCVLEMPEFKHRFQSKREKRFLMHLILQHWFILETTTLSLCKEAKTQSKDANTVAIFQSLLNHSCFPNVSHQRCGNQMITYTVRPIKMGEQLFIDNGMMNNHFQCKCSKCNPSWQREDRNRMESEPDFKDIKRFDDSGDGMNPDERSILKAKMVNFLTKYGELPWSPEIEEVMTHFKSYMFKCFSK